MKSLLPKTYFGVKTQTFPNNKEARTYLGIPKLTDVNDTTNVYTILKASLTYDNNVGLCDSETYCIVDVYLMIYITDIFCSTEKF